MYSRELRWHKRQQKGYPQRICREKEERNEAKKMKRSKGEKRSM